ncbi:MULTISPECIES: SDR family NAD(P)-dependent oxidoreductase [Arhodomonas]|uniref:SDR family NAD(P)-dependent oxidoreductase n=1 Tax=Arhodomonas TaxID=2368 RepID=UPI00058E379E|nr:SDR family NAD(P)-dependent oxidoreductase [Arhodomonas aquaeolei]
METVSVITGGGSGIGRALARRLAGAGGRVLVVGRRRLALEETAEGHDGIEVVAADIAEAAGRDSVATAVGERAVRYLVHNAGRLEPVGPLAGVSVGAWRASQAVNVEAPLFLTQALLSRLPGGRVLHVSSGAAHRAIPGWGAYCTSKAALYMLYTVLREELRDRDIAVGSLRPGVVDTDMQALIREQDEADFPAVARFRALKEAGELEPPERVAAFVEAVLTGTETAAFGAEEWDIREHAARFGID